LLVISLTHLDARVPLVKVRAVGDLRVKVLGHAVGAGLGLRQLPGLFDPATHLDAYM
jgi:hypothetical protein